MLGSLSDTLIIIVVAILLLGGEKDISGTVKNIGKYWNQIRNSENDFRKEITRELSDMDMNMNDPPRQASDIRVRQLERQVRELQDELERMKKKNGDE
ncbi:MAG: translocase [Nitrososphaerota archaeon]|nr:translocase [Nitrososphaerota archaeon]MDG6928013.1 translocase [Nitrososphaerota archaeon]MDG6931084.1 translocase [Nitrososphaerota archaeon]MDG6932772.1 translocase [Nitrososphaerota archaeon]MDG6936533.1 translocase [Nitrososphaerota archaeon]